MKKVGTEMEFYTVYRGGRPVRCGEHTRRFAWESMHGRYGDEAMATPAVALDDLPGFAGLTDQQKYDAAVGYIAACAPLRVCPAERVSGAATLGMAIAHLVPATWQGKSLWSSVSHVTLGFDRVLRQGVNALEREIDERLADDGLDGEQRAILTGMGSTVDALRVWHRRYLDATKDTNPETHALLQRVPFEPARTFHEAVQSLWFTFAFTRLTGNWSGIGRIDEMLGDTLRQDLASGRLTLDEAREILASFFIKGCEWIQSDTPVGSGDAQHYQNIVLAGMDRNGVEVTNEVTHLVLDIVEEFGISDFPITVRIGPNTPDSLLRRVAEVMRHGGGVVAVYNEPLILEGLTRFGYPLEEARCFANDGCWEVQVPGKTYFTYSPFDSLRLLLDDTLGLHSPDGVAAYASFEELYAAYREALRAKVEDIYRSTLARFTGSVPGEDWHWGPTMPCSVVSLFTEGCVASGRSYLGGGATHTVVSPHIGGVVDTANSLLALKKLVFEEKKVDWDTLMAALRANWEGYEPLRQVARNRYVYFGNDDDEADAMVRRVLDDFATLVEAIDGRSPIRFPAGVSTFGRQIEWAPFRAATPFGYRAGEILSGNFSPTPGTDSAGATAMIRSYCKADHRRLSCGSALDVKLFPATVQGPNGAETLMALLRGFVALGGFFLQLDVVDGEVLREAQRHPENYKTLSVRVSGWNARFVTLDREWQDMIVERTALGR